MEERGRLVAETDIKQQEHQKVYNNGYTLASEISFYCIRRKLVTEMYNHTCQEALTLNLHLSGLGLSQVTELTSSDRRSLKYFVLYQHFFAECWSNPSQLKVIGGVLDHFT